MNLRPDPLEIACGLVVNEDEQGPPLDRSQPGPPRAVLESAVLRALRRAPCLVSFSGGRDSSAVLALAAMVARREGLALPVPVTYRCVNAPGSQEDQWQEQVVGHLGLTDWERITVVDELDCVGPAARAVLTQHGLLWPFNSFFHAPLLARATGGSLLTGVGGDEALAPQEWYWAQRVLARRSGIHPRHVLTVGLAVAPDFVQTRVLARRHQLRFPWLRPEVDEHVNVLRAAHRARTPLRWDGTLEFWWRSRARAVLIAGLETLAAHAGTQLVQPFAEPSFMGAIARRYGAFGPVSRGEALIELFGDVAPDAVLSRRSKAFFDEAFFAEPSRVFVAEWDGGDVDTRLVDSGKLTHVWRGPGPDPRSFLLLQSAWLAKAS